MDFFETLNAQILKKDFGANKFVLSSKSSVFSLNRPHTSLSMVSGNASEININEVGFYPRKDDEKRYVIAKEILFELLITIYEVNTHKAILIRISKPLDAPEIAKIKGWISKIGKSNFEMRAIGMQNGDLSLLKSIKDLHIASKANLIEVDLFGNTKRHFALDLKTGMSYDLLLQDKIYRAEELINNITLEEFKAAQISKLKFV